MPDGIRARREVLTQHGLPLTFEGEFKDVKTLNLAQEILSTLAALPRESPKEASRSLLAKQARTVLKKVSKNLKEHPQIKACARELLAYKIGVPSSVFECDANQGFEQFASKPPLAPYLEEYDHTVKIGANEEVWLLKDDVYTPWSWLKEGIQIPKRDPAADRPWPYGPQGVQNKNMFEWTELKPYKQEDPAQWGNQYIFEFCCCCDPKMPHFTGDHSWLRLKTPEGDIYCVGLYRPHKHDPMKKYKFPLREQKGYLQQPDMSEFWGIPVYRIPFAITEEQFKAMKQMVEQDQQKDTEIFQLIGKNCTQYVEKIGGLAEIKLPIEKPFWELLNKRCGYPCIQTGVEAAANILPTKVSSVFASIYSCTCNTILSCAGANRMNREICDPIIVKHPFTLGHDTKDFVNAARAGLDPFSCPPSCRKMT